VVLLDGFSPGTSASYFAAAMGFILFFLKEGLHPLHGLQSDLNLGDIHLPDHPSSFTLPLSVSILNVYMCHADFNGSLTSVLGV
jgi:hypothetical protein